MKEFFQQYAMRGFFGGSGSGNGSDDTQTYILVDESGNEYPAVAVSEETVFDATANDIRQGKVAVTDSGVTTGTKEIPAYYTSEGVQAVPGGSAFTITNMKNCEYTKLQALICKFNTSLSDSVATDKVSINDGVYAVDSTEIVATVTVDVENSTINLGITNEGTVPYVIRFFTYKEEV